MRETYAQWPPTGRGDVRRLMRKLDWACTATGHPASWPQELRILVQLMLDSAFPMFVAWGPKLGFLYNDAYARILGDKHPSALGRPFSEIWSEIWNDVSPIIDDALAGKSSYFEDMPLTVFRKGYPEQAWFTFSFSPANDGNGDVAGMYCTVVETTSQVLAHRRQAFQLDLAERLRPLSSPEDIAAAATDLLGRHLGMSRVWYAEIDDGARRFYTKSMWTDGELPPIPDTGRIDDFGPTLIDALKQHGNFTVSDFTADARMARHAHKYAALAIGAILIVPMIKAGQLLSTLNLSTSGPRWWAEYDIQLASLVAETTWATIERARAEEALRASQLRSDNALAVAQLGTFDWDIRTNQVLPSPRTREIFGFQGGEGYDAQDYFSRIAEEDISRIQYEIEAALRGDGRLHTEYRIRLSDGRIRHVVSMSACQKNSRGAWERHIGVFADITERKQVEHELRDANRRKDEFLAMLAHELRNPLAPISTAAHLLKVAPDDAARIGQCSDIISRQVAHMTKLVNDLLDVSRVTRGLVVLERHVLDIRGVIMNAIEQSRPLIETRGHDLSFRMHQQSLSVLGDRTRLVQVLANVLNNAAKYTPPGGRIAIDVEVHGEELCIVVSDNGNGIDGALLPHVFELFTQARRTPDRSQGGLGLGLALVRSIMNLHGGRAEAHSSGQGKGTVIRLYLPLLHGEHAQAGSVPAPQPAARPARPLHFMVVDDNADAAHSLAALLQLDGHHVKVHENAQGALASVADAAPDVFILDIGLPDMDGYELARQLRRRRPDAATVYVALSGYGQPHDIEQSRQAGFDHHFVKPLDTGRFAELLNSIARH